MENLNYQKRAVSCCFTGHRKVPDNMVKPLKKRISTAVTDCCAHGITRFFDGGAQGFDLLAAEAVLSLRAEYPQVQLVLVIPHQEQTRGWNLCSKERYEAVREKADEVVCLAEHYYRGCMQQRNRYMVNHSSLCVCYLTESRGGTAATVAYAQRQGLFVLNLALGA